MSEAHDIIGDIVDDRAGSTTDPVTILDGLNAGRVITAEIEGPIDPILLPTDLGEDSREVVKLHVTKDEEAALISRGNTIQFTLFGQTVRHSVLKRENNAASPQTDFWCAKIVEGKDT